MENFQHFPLAAHFAFPPLLRYSLRNSLGKIVSADVTNRNARKSTPHNFRRGSTEFVREACIESEYGCFSFFLLCVPDEVERRKMDGARRGAIT